MTFDDFTSLVQRWFQSNYSDRAAKLTIEPLSNGNAWISLTGVASDDLTLYDPAPFKIVYSEDDALENTQLALANSMLTRNERLRELMMADINDPESGALIDGFYTDFPVIESDRIHFERFFQSSDLETRREALIALTFGVNKDSGPRFIGYAKEALILHILGVIEGSDSQYTGPAVLNTLHERGDTEATAILRSLRNNEKWRRRMFV